MPFNKEGMRLGRDNERKIEESSSEGGEKEAKYVATHHRKKGHVIGT